MKLPDGWEPGLSANYWYHKTMVASVYLTDGEYVCAADQLWAQGTFPTFEEAAARALELASLTWAALRAEASVYDDGTGPAGSPPVFDIDGGSGE
jgi:hypothetical protein